MPNVDQTLLSAHSLMSLKLFVSKLFQVLKPEIDDFPFNLKLRNLFFQIIFYPVMINMSYEVEVSKPDHLEVLRETMTEWTSLEHDLHLISADGFKVSTSKVFLGLYSEHLRSILNQPLSTLKHPLN